MARRRKRKTKRREVRVQVPDGWLSGWCDGACAGNPGPMGIGGVLRDGQQALAEFSETAGPGSNNEAEYLAMIRLLELGLAHGGTALMCHSDSELVVRQLNGGYAVRKRHLYRLYRQALRLANQYPGAVRFVWIPRDQNTDADALASRAVGMPQAPMQEGHAESWCPDPAYQADPEALAALPQTGAAIARFLSLSSPRFRDYLGLRTGGMDGYSRLRRDRLREIISLRHGPGAVAWLARALEDLEDSAYGKNALRWCARGLLPDLALKKASVDLEMANRFVRKKTG